MWSHGALRGSDYLPVTMQYDTVEHQGLNTGGAFSSYQTVGWASSRADEEIPPPLCMAKCPELSPLGSLSDSIIR